MIVAVWKQWVERGQWWWLVVLAAVFTVDLLLALWLGRNVDDAHELARRYWEWVTGT